ncbi:DUF3667 domain-containing protein [Dyella subtropica]|uniref:DUF3667 domain-containing protein n=1 Tax=Dyella subtropica TaxID=2992127 RepID=UPI00224DD4A1|nr:DUF3667 domain-containing protein [Dyella subtropica]
MEDTLETVFHIDGRVVHTVPPLLTKPGFLTMEYFSGRRQRYIAPFRLMFMLCLLAFFLTHVAIDVLAGHRLEEGPPLVQLDKNTFDDLKTPAEVQRSLDEQLAGIRTGREATPDIAQSGLNIAEKKLRKQAAARIAVLQAAGAPAASASAAIPADHAKTDDEDSGDNEKWLHKPSDVHIAWLPEFANARLTHAMVNIKANLEGLSKGGTAKNEALERIKAGLFGVLPQTMFLMMPVFALLLKLAYLFKRRLYMEHLIVALHSHAFLFLTLLLAAVLALLKAWIEPHAAWAAYPLRWIEWGLALWAPIYLLVMQKRIYRQGWFMTTVKYFAIGWCYLWLLSIALASAVALGLAR